VNASPVDWQSRDRMLRRALSAQLIEGLKMPKDIAISEFL